MTDDELVRLCQSGDISAFKMLFDRHHQMLLRVALRLLGRQQDAEDAVQQTFINVYRGINGFRFQAKFSTFLLQILKRVCFDAMRAQKRRQHDRLEKVTKLVDPPGDLKAQLETAIGRLPERMRLCFVLFAVEELKQEDIAGIMGMTVGGVKSTLFQARVRLRRFLED